MSVVVQVISQNISCNLIKPKSCITLSSSDGDSQKGKGSDDNDVYENGINVKMYFEFIAKNVYLS